MRVPPAISRRLAFIRASINRPWPRAILGCITGLGLYDMAGSQLVPPTFAKLPKAWELIESLLGMTPDMTPITWLALLFIVVAGTVIEYAYRTGNRHSAAVTIPVSSANPGLLRNSHQLHTPKPEKTEKKKYAPPDDAKDLDWNTVTNKELGKLLEVTGHDVGKFRRNLRYDAPDSEVVSTFNKTIGPHVLWAYEEARRRGCKDSNIEDYYVRPENLSSREHLRWLGEALVKMGARVTLFLD